ncbi:MAG: hypothetical protein AAFR18_22070 [Cyanobacteria bacterium J06627_32]
MLFAELPDFSTGNSFLWIMAAGLGLLLLKVSVLIWAYAKTYRLATLVYALYVIAQSITPILLSRLLPVEQFAYYSFGINFLEIPLFAWLVISLARRSQTAATLPHDSHDSHGS